MLKGICTGTRGAYLIEPSEYVVSKPFNTAITSVLKDAHSVSMSDVIKPGIYFVKIFYFILT